MSVTKFCVKCWEPLRRGPHRCADATPLPSPQQQRRDFNRQRALELAMLYMGGCTLQEIGDAIQPRLSRERVRQLIVATGLDVPKTGRRAVVPLVTRVGDDAVFRRVTGITADDRQSKRLQKRERCIAALRAAYRRHGETPTLTEVARELGLSGKKELLPPALQSLLRTAFRERGEPKPSCAEATRRLYATLNLNPIFGRRPSKPSWTPLT